MKSFLQTLARHPVSVICYGLYTWLCYIIYRDIIGFHRWVLANPHKRNIGYGESVIYLGFLLVAVATVFEAIILINVIISKKNQFYLWLMMIVLVQTIITLNVG